MKNLLDFILKGIIPDSKYEIEEENSEADTKLIVKVDPESTGLVIGKEGRTIKAIRNLLRVRATLEKKTFFLEVKN